MRPAVPETIEPFDAVQSTVALAAWRRFGKDRYPAGPNLGNRYSSALAKSRGAPLLFQGDDFTPTDVEAAIPEQRRDDPPAASMVTDAHHTLKRNSTTSPSAMT
jgi:hypothetical protein